jgi:GrpB-like predicted nucleotidyltransferase (UPF0157 family)
LLGLKHNVNLLVDYDADWPRMFLEEQSRISEALGDTAKAIEHYGSTAVPGMRAKPILDILVGVDPLEDWVKCRAPLEVLGYDYAENAGVPEHHIFGRGSDRAERTHLVHVVEHLGRSWRSCIALREALRNDHELRARYTEEKERAVAAAPVGRALYNRIKGPFLDWADSHLHRR